jgi:hypothetical protein
MTKNHKTKQRHPNPKGKQGKPFSIAPATFEEAVRKMLSTQPPKNEPKEKPRKKLVKQ